MTFDPSNPHGQGLRAMAMASRRLRAAPRRAENRLEPELELRH